MKEVPIWEKYTLSIDEASAYFNIGTNKLRALIKENSRAEWILRKSTHVSIKRKKFENFIDSIDAI